MDLVVVILSLNLIRKREIEMAAGNVLCLVKCNCNSWTYSIQTLYEL